MPQLISDDGQIATFLTEDGRTVQVASQHAQPFMPEQPPSLGGDIAPMGAIDQVSPPLAPDATPTAAPPPGPPAAEIYMPPDQVPPTPGLFSTQTGAPQIPAGIGEGPPPAPPSPEEITAEPDIVNPPEPPPNILPQGPLNTPTQVAGAVNQAGQEQAESAFRKAEAFGAANEDIIQESAALDERLAQIEAAKEQERQDRAKDEALLKEDYTKKVERFAKWRADPTRGMSTERQAMGWIGVALAGIGQVISGRDPSQNPALQQLIAGAEQRVQLQMLERDQMGAELGLKKEAIADFRQGTTNKLAEYDVRMAGQLQRHAALVDRVGKRYESIEQREAAKQLAATLRAQAAQFQGTAVAKESEARARARAARQAAVMRSQEAAEKQRRWMAEHDIVGVDPKTGLYIKAQGGEEALKTEKLGAETTKAKADAAAAILAGSPEERERQFGVGGIKTSDGQPVLAGNVDEAKVFRAQKAATDNAALLIDKMIAAREKYGWSSDLLKSDEWRTIKADHAALQLEIKETGKLGVLAGPDMGVIDSYVGTSDPTEVRDPTAGLKTARSNIVNKYNSSVKSLNPKAARYEPPKFAARVAVESKTADNLSQAFTPLDPDEAIRGPQLEARAAAYDEIARKGTVGVVTHAAQALRGQFERGEIEEDAYKALLSKLAKRKLKLEAGENRKAAVTPRVGFDPNSPAMLGEGWENRTLFPGSQ
jgi:hypothetical protein